MGLGLTKKSSSTNKKQTVETVENTAPQTTTQQTNTPATNTAINNTTNTTKNTSGGTSSGGTYDANKNYSKLIQEAVASGDYRTAAQLEVERNYKVDDMNALGTNTNGYTTTNNYAGWLDTTDYGTIAKQQMAYGASPDEVQETYNNRYNKSANTIGLQQYADDALMQQMLAYINSAQNTELPEFDEEYWTENQPTFSDNYAGISEELFNKILSRENFSYNAEDDPLYQQYAEMYRREGDRARENTLADIASSAGGMNSWAVTAAQQAQNNYNAQLGDKIPELYQLAYQMYLNEKASDVENFGLANQMSDRQYNRYMDQMNLWRDDRNFAFDYYLSDWDNYKWGTEFNSNVNQNQIANDRYDKEWEYGVSTDQYNREQAENETAYNREQQEINDARAWAIDLINAGTTPDAATLQKAGLTLAQAQQMAAAQKASGSKSSGGSSGGGYDATTTDTPTKSGITSEIRTKAASFSSNTALDNYLIGLIQSGVITSDEALALSAEYSDPNEKYAYDAEGNPTTNYSYRDMVNSTAGWEVNDDGGTNWGGGVDNDAILTAPTGEQMRADALVDRLVEEGMTASEARDAVEKLQKNLNS